MPNFVKSKTKAKMKRELVSFRTGTSGLRDHDLFIKWVNDKNVKIVHAYTLYHDYSHSHIPASLNYVIQYKNKPCNYLTRLYTLLFTK